MCGWLVKAMLSRLRLARFILTISKWWWDLFCLVYFQGSLWLEFIQWFVAAIVLLYLFDLTSCWKYCIIAFLCPFQTPFIGEMCVIVVTTILNIPLDSYLKIVHLEEKIFFEKIFLLKKMKDMTFSKSTWLHLFIFLQQRPECRLVNKAVSQL